MTRKILSILMAICLFECCASAQWYLFPGSRKTVEKTEETEKVAAKDTVVVASEAADVITEALAEQALEEAFVLDIPQTVNITLALPVQASTEKPNGNFLDMYSGALLAVRNLANNGMKISLTMVDTKEGAGLSESDILSSDVLIGPVSYDDVLAAARKAEGKAIISPLEPRTAALVDSLNIVQSPTTWKMQVNELIDWLSEEAQSGDEIIVVKDTSATGYGEQAKYLMETLKESGLRYSSVTSLSKAGISKYHDYRILIASDKDSFITSAVRAASTAGQTSEANVTLYCTAKVRTSVGADIIDLHNASTRLTASYFIDYDNPSVKDFILAYRALFNEEPGSFAFQGYDAVKYYATMCSIYGRQWYKKLPEHSERGLQADFLFSEAAGSGRQNVAIRRIVYNKDLSTSLQ